MIDYRNTYLINGIFALFSVHLRHIDNLHDVGVSVGYRLDLHGVAEATFANDFQFPVPVHCLRTNSKFITYYI